VQGDDRTNCFDPHFHKRRLEDEQLCRKKRRDLPFCGGWFVVPFSSFAGTGGIAQQTGSKSLSLFGNIWNHPF
jgi:hypothetical protein